jgi:hypothetical protein
MVRGFGVRWKANGYLFRRGTIIGYDLEVKKKIGALDVPIQADSAITDPEAPVSYRYHLAVERRGHSLLP